VFGNFVITLIQRSTKMKNKKYHTVGTVPKFNSKLVERGKIGTLITKIHDRSFSWMLQTIQ
jgi:hypothetical protein